MSSKVFSTPKKRIFTVATGVLFLISSFCAVLGAPPQATAISTSGFDAGNIMSDAVMSNKSTMTQSQIQSFMLSKNSCNKSVSSAGGHVIDDSETQAHWSGSSITYQISGGKKGTTNGTFRCLAKSSFSGQSAAQIIYQASQDYNVNPQVLLVLLEKEQGLITDLWPNSTQLASATGYNCPDDDAGCRASDAAFKKQIRGAANMFNSILTKKYGWTNFYPVGTNYIQYNPSTSCGGSNVKIQNLATSALYNYTPYQPNAATLKAGWPSPGAPCGAYGNLNFYMYFTTWFGPTDGYVSLDTPRWMQLNQDVKKTDLKNGELIEDTLPKGTQLFFTTKIKLNGVWYLRTKFDTEHYLSKAIPLSAISDITYNSYKTVSWKQLNKDSNKINPVTGKRVESFKKGTQFQVAGRITVNGITYLRTVFDSGRNVAAAFNSSDVTNIPYSPLPNPHWMVLNKDTKKVNPITNVVDSGIQSRGTQVFVDSTITVGGVQYMRIKADTQNNIALALPATSLDEIPYTTLPRATWMNLKASTVKYNPATGEVVGQETKDLNQLQFSSSITVNGKKYLRSTFDTEHNLNKGILASDASIINYVPLQTPRNFVITKDTYKIVPETGINTNPYMNKGAVLFFDTKMYVDGVWYLRSQYDTSHNYNKGVPLSKLENT